MSIRKKDKVNRGEKYNGKDGYVKHVQESEPQDGYDETDGVFTDGRHEEWYQKE